MASLVTDLHGAAHDAAALRLALVEQGDEVASVRERLTVCPQPRSCFRHFYGMCGRLTAWAENMREVRKVDIRLPGKGILNLHGARPVY